MDILESLQQQRSAIAELCRTIGAKRLDIFGSAVRDNFDAHTSDLDFLVEFDNLPPARYAEAYFALKEGLESLFERPVDLVTEPGLNNPYFRERVAAERHSIYAR